MRFTTARLALVLAMLGLGACGRTELDMLRHTDAGAGADEDEGSGAAGAGGARISSSSAMAGAGGSSVPNSLVPKGGLPSIAGSVSGGAIVVGGSPASGGRSMVGGSSVTSGVAGRSAVGGSSIVAGSYRPAGTTAAGGSVVAGSVVAGRIGSGGTAGGAGTISSARGGTTLSSRTGGTVVSTGGRPSPLPLENNEELIDDMNDGDRFIAKAGGRVGAWKTSTDGTPGTMVPDPSTPFVPTDTGDANAKYAVYVKGSGFTSQGSNVSLGLGAPYDASKYTGISFWAKSDAGSTYARVLFPDKDTDLDAGLCSMSGPTSNMCYDHYGYRFSFTPGWNKYIIPFKSLTQDGWGRKGTAFDPSTVFEVIFQFPANSTYAVWIDNLAFTL